MGIDFNRPILDSYGKPLIAENNGMTIASCCIGALNALHQGEDVTAEIKVRRFVLAVRIAEATDPLDLTADDITIIKACVGRFWSPLLVGRCWQALDPESVKV